MLNEAYSRVEYRLEREGFDNVPALIRYYVGNRKPVSQVGLVTLFTLPLFYGSSHSQLICWWSVKCESQCVSNWNT